MLMDSQLVFDDGVAITATRDSTNVINFVNDRDMGIGGTVQLMVLGSGTFASAGGTATLSITVRYSEDNSTYFTAAQSPPLTITQLNSAIANNQPYLFPISLPRPRKGTDTTPQYVKLAYDVGTENFTAGTITAALVIGRDDVVYYPRNYSVAV